MDAEKINNLKALLDKEHDWPSHYRFKFIYKSTSLIKGQLEAIFPKGSEHIIKKSSKENYESLTVNHLAKSADEILDLYKEASLIKGLITL